MSGPPPTPPGPLRHDPAPLPAPGPRPRPPHTGADPTSPWYRPPEPPPFPAATATAPEGDLGVGPGAANGTGGTPRRLGALLALIVSVPLAIGTVASALGSLARPTPATTESGRPEAVVSVVPTEPSTTAPNPDDDYPALSPARARTDALTGVLIPAGPARAMPPVPSDDGSRISLVERCRLVTWTTTAPKRGATSLEVPGRAGRCPAAVSDDGRYLVVVGESGLLLRGTSGTGTARLTGTAVPEAFRITEDGRRLVGLVEGTKLATWDLAHPGNDPDLVSLPSRPLQWQVGASGEVAGTLGKEGELNLWNLTTTDPLGTISPFLGSEPFAISPDGTPWPP